MKVDFGGVEEKVVTRKEFSVSRDKEILKDTTIAVIGYGVQGPAQAMNMRDNGLKVIVGQSNDSRQREYWKKAIRDGWVPGETLFPVGEAAERGVIIQYLVSDAAQRALWPEIKPHLTQGKALYFSHGFSIAFSDQTGFALSETLDLGIWSSVFRRPFNSSVIEFSEMVVSEPFLRIFIS